MPSHHWFSDESRTNFSQSKTVLFLLDLFYLIIKTIMESFYRLPFSVVQCPNLKLKKPSWIRKPSNTT